MLDLELVGQFLGKIRVESPSSWASVKYLNIYQHIKLSEIQIDKGFRCWLEKELLAQIKSLPNHAINSTLLCKLICLVSIPAKQENEGV